MADGLRKIGASIVLEGEASFRSALKLCNAELRNSRSELTLVEAKYKGNANSLEALEAKGQALSKCYENQKHKLSELNKIVKQAEKNQEKFKNAADQAGEDLKEAEEQLKELKNTSGDTAEEQEKLTNKINEHRAAQKSNTEAYNRASVSLENWKTRVNQAEKEETELSAQIKENTKYIEEARKSTDGCSASIDEYGKKVKEAGKGSENWGEQTANAANAIATVMAASGIKEGIDKITAAIKDSTEAAIEFESAITGVFKTVDGTDDQLQAISDGILEMSYRIPSTTTEIAGVAESAGQLGIAREDVLDFTEVMIGLGEATNLSSEEAASSLAKFANITKMSANDYSKLGSVIVDLGNNFATTEADIVAMATRMASAGTMAGLSQSQILALAAALSSVGNEAEAGGSAASKLLTEISLSVETSSDSLKMFAEVANMSAEEFSQAWRNDAAGALTAFITGLNDTTRLGKSTIAMLDDLGITEIRLSNATRSLANYSEGLTSAFETAESAWVENIALQNEVSKRYATTESKMQILKNAANGLKIAVGNALLPTMNSMAETGADVLKIATEFVEENPQVVKGIVAATAAGTAFIGTVTVATTAITLFKAAMDVAGGGTTFIAGAIVSLIAALGTLVVTNLDAVNSFEDLTESAQNAKQAFDDASNTYNTTIADLESASVAAGTYIDRLAELEQQGINTEAQQAEYNLLIESLKSLMPDLNIEIDEQTGLIKGGTAALRENANAWIENAKQQAAATALADEYQALIEAQIALSKSGSQYQEQIKKSSDATKKAESAYKAIANAMGMSTAELDERIAVDSTYLEMIGVKYPDLVQQYNDAKEAMWEENVALDQLGEAHNENANIVTEMKESYAVAEEAIKSYAGATDEAAISQGNLAASVTDSQATFSQESASIQKLYLDTYEAARESIEGQVGLFERFDEASATLTSNDVKTNLVENAKSLDEFTQSYQTAVDKGYDPNFLKQFEDFTPDNLQVLNELVAKTPDEVEEFNRAWDELEKSKHNYSDTLGEIEKRFAEAETDIALTAATMADDLDKYEETRIAGNNFCDGFLNVLSSRKGEFFNHGAALGDAATAGFNSRKGQDAHSPSHKTEKSADYFADGFILQLERRQRDLEIAAAESAQLAVAAMNSWQPQNYNIPQAAPVIDTDAITEAVRRGMQEANVTVDFDYRGYDKGRDKYDR